MTHEQHERRQTALLAPLCVHVIKRYAEGVTRTDQIRRGVPSDAKAPQRRTRSVDHEAVEWPRDAIATLKQESDLAIRGCARPCVSKGAASQGGQILSEPTSVAARSQCLHRKGIAAVRELSAQVHLADSQDERTP
jgi:hypothetical protein